MCVCVCVCVCVWSYASHGDQCRVTTCPVLVVAVVFVTTTFASDCLIWQILPCPRDV